jgi:hypothetical protein
MTALIFAFDASYRQNVVGGVASGAAVYWGALLVSGLCSMTLLAASGWLLPRMWRRIESAPPARLPLVAQPVALRSVLPRSTLDTEPLLWLAARGFGEPVWLKVFRWSAVIFFALMLLVSVTTNSWRAGFISAFTTVYGLHLVTRIHLALAATRQLSEDRRSGALELVLSTPVPDHAVVRAYGEASRRAARRSLWGLLTLNGVLQVFMMVFARTLHVSHGDWGVFTALFVGGAVVTLADFVALRWLALREALRGGSQLKVAGRVLAWLYGGSALGFGAAFLLAIGSNGETATGVFTAWVVFCLVYDSVLVARCRSWLRVGLRQRLAQA